jgi:multimeric flavodoxin WrbA
MNTVESMNHLFMSNDFIIAGRVLGMAREKGDMEKDEEGLQTAATLGQRMAWMLKKLHG